MKSTSHLKTNHNLFKEFEQYGCVNWDLQAAYDAQESFITYEEEGTNDEDDKDEGGSAAYDQGDEGDDGADDQGNESDGGQ